MPSNELTGEWFTTATLRFVGGGGGDCDDVVARVTNAAIPQQALWFIREVHISA